MIVRNEAHVVTETLASVAPHIQSWVIVDTGSTDGTPELISSFFAAHGIPGEIHHRPWVNFGFNRTEALELCRNKAEYIWVIDADDLVHGTPDFSNLTLDSYLLKFGTAFRYWRKQIFRSSLRWKYEGALHEYPVCLDANSTEARLDGDYYIDSRNLGSRSRVSDKYERDAQILLDVVTRNPDDERSTFYLAQSYRDAGKLEEALKYYKRRAEMGGWDEEVFYSLLQVGECLERAAAPWEAALDAYLRSWQSRPQRAEPLYRIARHYRIEHQYDLAYLFASRAREIPFPEDDRLFIGAAIYDWQIDDELAISAYYLGKYRESFDLCTRLLDLPSVPEPDRERISANRDFATEHLTDAETDYPDSLVQKLTERKNTRRDPPRVVLTITTCQRYELFEKAVNSFLNCCLDIDLIDGWICIDDGSSDADRRLMAERYPFFEFILKDRSEKGHARSMNMLLDRIESPYWLHLEDDWQFFVRDTYISKALAILDDDRSIGQVLFNKNYGETLECRDIHGGLVKHTAKGHLRYRVHEHIRSGTAEYESYMQSLPVGTRSNAWWPHYSLRPSLIRMSAIRDVGRYWVQSEHFELDFAERYFTKGYRSAFLDSINSLHIGRLTWEVGKLPNAYDLNDEPYLGLAVRRPYRVKLLANWTSSKHLNEFWNRQSKSGDHRWEDVETVADDEGPDYWAIINHPQSNNEKIDKRRTIIFHMEPEQGVATWGEWASPDSREFLQVRSHRQFPNNSEWHLDLNYSQLLSSRIEKTMDLSCVTSSKFASPGHQLRIGFLKYLEESGVPIDIFGHDNLHGFRNYRGPLPAFNKDSGIVPYRYTLAIENHAERNYFSEKIVDGILGECLCFYWGCPNLEEYLDSHAFIRLPLEDFERSREIVENAIRDNEHARRLEAIRRAKRQLLDHYQFFPTMSRIIRGHKIVERLEVRAINLDRRRDRWQSLQERMKDVVGHDILDRCERVSAVDGNSLVMDPAIEEVFRGNDFNYRRGIVACALSHLSIWRELAKSDDAICLVLEDDVLFCEGFYGQLVEVCGNLSDQHADFDLVFLGYHCWPEFESDVSDEGGPARLSPMEWRRYLGGTHAYLISSSGARKLLRSVEAFGIQNGIDWFIMRRGHELKVLQCLPNIATAKLAIPGTSVDSDIQHDVTSLRDRGGAREEARQYREEPVPRVRQAKEEKLPESLRSFLSSQLRGTHSTWPAGVSDDEIEKFVAYTDDCGIQPWLYHLVQSSQADAGYPERVLQAFRGRQLMETISARLRADEAKSLASSFDQAGVRALILKGTALGSLVYPHPGRRPACDVDILIDADQLATAESILRRQGYYAALSYSQQVTYRKETSTRVVHNIDLHLAISEARVFSRAFSFDELFSRSISLPALEARTLCPIDSLLHCCIHLAQHREWERLIWLCDIDLLAVGLSDEDASQFVRLSREKRIAAICARALSLALMTFGSEWRSEELRAFARRRVSAYSLLEPSAHYLATSNILLHDFLLLMRSGNAAERSDLLRRIVFNPGQIKRLEISLLPAYLKPFVKTHRRLTTAIARMMRRNQLSSPGDNV